MKLNNILESAPREPYPIHPEDLESIADLMVKAFFARVKQVVTVAALYLTQDKSTIVGELSHTKWTGPRMKINYWTATIDLKEFMKSNNRLDTSLDTDDVEIKIGRPNTAGFSPLAIDWR